MKPLYLYLEDFQCHEKSEIDFSSFESALLVGKMNSNDLVANGVGKSSIFKAIEYVFFNEVRDPLLEKSMILEELIRDDTQKVTVTLDFLVKNEVYRVTRSRNRKGISDLSLFKRNAVEPDKSGHTPETDKTLWDDLSSRRTADTEAELSKKIKINYRSFLNTVHFMQLDMTSGLATATPANRKAILKDPLGLLVYGKLEKIAKERAAAIIKDIDKERIVFDSIAASQQNITDLSAKIAEITILVKDKNSDNTEKKGTLDKLNSACVELNSQLSVLEANAAGIITKRNNLTLEVEKLDASVLDYSRKRKIVLDRAQTLTAELKALQTSKKELDEINLSRIDEIKLNIDKLSSDIGFQNASINTLKTELEELRIPMPEDGSCKHCRQILTDAHRDECQNEIANKILDKEDALTKHTVTLKFSIDSHKVCTKELKDLEIKQKELNTAITEIAAKEQELAEKKKIYEEHTALIKSFSDDLLIKKEELKQVKVEVENSSEKEINELKAKLLEEKRNVSALTSGIDRVNNEINDLNSKIAVLQHSIEEKKKEIKKKADIGENIVLLEKKYNTYPLAIQAFGTTGIPNLIIQNVLEDFQEESNKFLAQIKPGLQLSFSTEKTKGDGSLDDTLDINYFLNNKPRSFSQLSGAQRLCISFSLKIGLAFLLWKMSGAQIKFLLLDELDQSLDKASTDAFADIVKLLQKDFTVLVVTHNDRLKDKFTHAILVEQDQNMVSKASVVTSW